MSKEAIKTKKDPEFVLDTEVIDFEIDNDTAAKRSNDETPKVNINSLMDRVREEKKKEKKENLIFLGLIASVVLVTGAIASF
tara:strand:+ start:275 stop:520 length:246 start_codon:yes stop_codon:yes gene_type:complete